MGKVIDFIELGEGSEVVLIIKVERFIFFGHLDESNNVCIFMQVHENEILGYCPLTEKRSKARLAQYSLIFSIG